jgi:hypothetical protein
MKMGHAMRQVQEIDKQLLEMISAYEKENSGLDFSRDRAAMFLSDAIPVLDEMTAALDSVHAKLAKMLVGFLADDWRTLLGRLRNGTDQDGWTADRRTRHLLHNQFALLVLDYQLHAQ